jgi:hypothetical protein
MYREYGTLLFTLNCTSKLGRLEQMTFVLGCVVINTCTSEMKVTEL